MTHKISASTAIEGTAPTLRFPAANALGVFEEEALAWFRSSANWPPEYWQGTISEFPDIRLQELTAITIDLSGAISACQRRGPAVPDGILSITDAPNAVVDMPTAAALSRKLRIYRQAEASTAGDDYGQSSSTIMQRELTRRVEDAVAELFELAEEQSFEDGMESDFSRDLVSLITKYGDLAMSEIAYLVTYDRVDREVASEALRWLGRIDDPSTHDSRLWVLRQGLTCKSPLVRDGAALGLASIRDAKAVQCLREAVERETIAELRYDLQAILEGLEVSLDATSTKEDSQA